VAMSGCCWLHILASVGFVFMLLWFDHLALLACGDISTAKVAGSDR
jgi:hypothetical protein